MSLDTVFPKNEALRRIFYIRDVNMSFTSGSRVMIPNNETGNMLTSKPDNYVMIKEFSDSLINKFDSILDYQIKFDREGTLFVEIKHEDDYSNDKETRKEIWNELFNEEKFPSIEDDAANKYAGSLVKDNGFSDEEIVESLDED